MSGWSIKEGLEFGLVDVVNMDKKKKCKGMEITWEHKILVKRMGLRVLLFYVNLFWSFSSHFYLKYFLYIYLFYYYYYYFFFLSQSILLFFILNLC